MKKIIYIVVIFSFFQIINGQTKRDPRVVGLSGAYTTIAEGIFCVGYNPALITRAHDKPFMLQVYQSDRGFLGNFFSIENVAAGINYGLDRVRFPNATKSDSTYRGRVSLIEFSEIPGGAKYKLKIEIEIKGEEKPACIAEFLALAYTK